MRRLLDRSECHRPVSRAVRPSLFVAGFVLTVVARSSAQERLPTSQEAGEVKLEAQATRKPVDDSGFREELVERLRGARTGPVLTADRAAARAVAASADVKAKHLSVEAEQAATRQAGLGWWPRLNLTARYTRYSPYDQPSLGPFVVAPGVAQGPVPPGTQLTTASSTFPAFINNYYLQAQLIAPITDYLFRVSQLTDSADASEESARLRERAARLQAAAEARLAYFVVARARLAESVAEQTLTSATAQRDAAAAKVDLGKTARVDLLQAEARLAAAQGMVKSAHLATERAEADLRTRLGAPVDEPLVLPPDVLQPLPEATGRPLAELYEEARRKRLELRAYEAAARGLERASSATRAEGYPRLDLFANAYYANPNLRFLPPEQEWGATWDVGAQLTWTPNDWATAEARASRQVAERERTLAERDALEQALRREVSAAVAEVQDADSALVTAVARRLAAEEAYRVRREMYEYNKATIVEVLSAETELVSARLDWVQVLVDQRIARVRLEHALGRDTEPPAAK